MSTDLPDYTFAITVQVGITTPEPLQVEEQYEFKERKALSVNTTGTSYTITTTSPKVLILVCETDDIFVDTQAISSNSPKLFKKTPLVWTLDGKVTTIYAKAVSSSGTLYLMVFA